MITRKQSAFTLIEMLIVVAIMSLLAAGSISYVTIPPREQLLATSDMENEQGLGAFFAKLVADAHNAARMSLAQQGRALIMEESGKDVSAVYFLDPKECLRRSLLSRPQVDELLKAGADWKDPAPAALLVGNVRRLEATPLENGARWRIGVSLTTKDPQHPLWERSIELMIGNSAMNSTPSPTKIEKSPKTRRVAEQP